MPRTEKQFQEMRERSRQNILNSALKVFAAKGYQETSISDIAIEASISKGLLYNYFSSKEDLTRSVMEMLLIELENMTRNVESEKDPYKKLRKLIEEAFDAMETNSDYWRLYSSFILQPETAKLISPEFISSLERIFNSMEKIFSEIGVKNAKEEAKIFGAILDGIAFHVMLEGESYPRNKMKKYLIKKYSKKNL
ncbi:MAG: TetR/AcrR family transcriptional regulator [Melioribacteraceae bacterium]|nr:TetR/AcrR family transcriptional regulator [Melioribacteraceae bacterium]MDD3557179.1 TetR/AcrR family transcriptional regulator [Melioribacteraceae bacterium]